MNLPLLIARRYFFSKYKRGFINVIAIISMLGVAISTIAMVFILSVFNGLEELHRKLFSTIDADIKVSARLGKNFEVTPELMTKLRSTPGVGTLTEVIEDKALVRYGSDAQMPVNLRGVSNNFLERKRMNSIIIEGKLVLQQKGVNYAVIGQGVQHILSVSLLNDLAPLQIWYPKNLKSLNYASLEKAFNRRSIRVGGVFALEQQYDDSYVFVPLDFAKDLFEYGNRRTALEILVKDGFQIDEVEKNIGEQVGNDFLVQNQEEQHASLLRAIKIEKFFVYFALSCIMAIASFNIFFSLTMLAIDKKKDVAVYYAMGAPEGLIKRIFISEGAIVALIGATAGLLLGVIFCLLQQRFGILSMGMTTSVVEAYPVKMQPLDFILTGITIIATTLLASYFPARKAAMQTELRV